jgi:hypothetical protein
MDSFGILQKRMPLSMYIEPMFLQIPEVIGNPLTNLLEGVREMLAIF